MQMMPVAVADYNRRSGASTSMNEQRRTDRASAHKQLDAGIWIFSRFLISAYDYLEDRLEQVEIPDLMRTAATFYVAGPGRAKAKFNKLVSPTWAAFERRYPDWPGTSYANTVWNRAASAGARYDLNRLGNWIGNDDGLKTKRPTIDGFLFGSLAIVLAMNLFKR
jgi:hypothetical protein